MSHWHLITFDTSWRTFQIFHWFFCTILFLTIPTYFTTHSGYTHICDPVYNWMHDVESKMQEVNPHLYSPVQLLSWTEIPLSLNAPSMVPGNICAVELLALSTPPPVVCTTLFKLPLSLPLLVDIELAWMQLSSSFVCAWRSSLHATSQIVFWYATLLRYLFLMWREGEFWFTYLYLAFKPLFMCSIRSEYGNKWIHMQPL